MEESGAFSRIKCKYSDLEMKSRGGTSIIEIYRRGLGNRMLYRKKVK